MTIGAVGFAPFEQESLLGLMFFFPSRSVRVLAVVKFCGAAAGLSR